MALYNVMFLCSDCGRFHTTKLSITVIDGPDRRKQIEEVYSPSPEISVKRTRGLARGSLELS